MLSRGTIVKDHVKSYIADPFGLGREIIGHPESKVRVGLAPVVQLSRQLCEHVGVLKEAGSLPPDRQKSPSRSRQRSGTRCWGKGAPVR